MSVTIDGLDRVQAWFRTREHRFDNPKPFFDRCVKILSESASKTWNAGGRPKWIDRKKSYPWPILEKTGRLRRSMEAMTEGGGAVLRMSMSSGDAWMEKGTSVYYGQHHQFGTSKMVARPFVQLHEEDVEAIEQAEDYFFED